MSRKLLLPVRRSPTMRAFSWVPWKRCCSYNTYRSRGMCGRHLCYGNASQRLWGFPAGNLVSAVFSLERDCYLEGRLSLALLTCLPGAQGNRDCSHSFPWHRVGDVVSRRGSELWPTLSTFDVVHIISTYNFDILLYHNAVGNL